MKLKHIWPALLVLLLSSVVLFGITTVTAGVAEEKETTAQQSLFAQLLPGSDTFTMEAYTGEDENITAVYKADAGYVVETIVRGYVDDIVVLVGVHNDGSVSGLTILDAAETSGLGQGILVNEPFLAQYLGTSGNAAVGENIDAITGATVTSKAVTKAVNSAAAFVTGADAASSATEWSG